MRNQGQNALAQAQQFHAAVGVTGLVLTKLDGTAQGRHRAGHRRHAEAADPLHRHRRDRRADFGVFDAGAFVDAVLSPARTGAAA